MKTLRLITILLLLFNGTGALYGGWLLITDPSGNSIGFTPGYLENSPFRNYLIPGIILFSANGICSIITLLTLLFRHQRYPLFVLLQGLILCIWIAVQLTMVKYVFFLHFLLGGTGLVLLVLGIALWAKMSAAAKPHS